MTPHRAGRFAYLLLWVPPLLLVASGCATFRQGVGYAGIGISMARSPLYLQTPPLNRALAPDTYAELLAIDSEVEAGTPREDAARGSSNGVDRERLDNLEDLRRDDTLLAVAISGGGARAALLATYALAELETRYNAALLAKGVDPDTRSLIDQIDVISSVSGGSLYTYHLSLNFLREGPRAAKDPVERMLADDHRGRRSERLQALVDDPRTLRGTRDLGFYSAVGYFAPANFFLPILTTLWTDRSYLDSLAAGLSVSRAPSGFFLPRSLKLGALRARPLFFFNATALATGGPFVISQNTLHLPSERRTRQSARLDAAAAPCCDRPLRNALTLEDIKSSPAEFPLAYAAVASAAFPIGIEPLPLQVYSDDAPSGELRGGKERVHLADGAIYDNSGLSSLADLIEYLMQAPDRGVKRVVVLAINADLWEGATRASSPIWRTVSRLPIGVGFPIRGIGAKAVSVAVGVGQQRVEELAYERIARATKNAGVETVFLPVHLLQLADGDPHSVAPSPGYFEQVRRVRTDFTLSAGDAAIIRDATRHLVDADQSAGGKTPELAWQIGDDAEPALSVGDAFVSALEGASDR